MRRSWMLSSAFAAGLAAVRLSAQPTPLPTPFAVISPELQVNTYTTGAQSDPDIAAGPNNGFVVVWTGAGQDGSETGIFGQRFDARGDTLGVEFQVNTLTTGSQYEPAIASDAAGNFVVAWSSKPDAAVQDADAFVRCFDANAAALGPELRVNTFLTSYQIEPDVAMADDGSFVVVWSSIPFMSDPPQDGNQGGVFGRLYGSAANPCGNASGGEFPINAYTTGDQRLPAVSINRQEGEFVVVWTGTGHSDPQTDVFGRVFAANGTPAGGEIQLNDSTTGAQLLPDVAERSNGDFVVAWMSLGGGAFDPNGVFARTYNAGAGGVLSPELPVNTYTTGFQARPRVALSPDGGFLVAWQGLGPDDPQSSLGGVYVRRFKESLASKDPVEYGLNTTKANVQFFPTLVTDPRGQTVVAWSSFNQDASDEGIFARRFGYPCAEPMAITGVFVGSAAVVPSWRNCGTTDLPLQGTAGNIQGPPGPTYTIDDSTANYGTLAPAAATDCETASGDCYVMSVSGARPVLHWDLTFDETLASSGPLGPVGAGATLTKTWALHIGGSFPDVPEDVFYPFVEILLHNFVTAGGGCGAGMYCGEDGVLRQQMAVFLLKARYGGAFAPPPASGTAFGDVDAGNPFAPWIEELSRQGVTGGCQASPPLFCPTSPVNRQQMAAFLLKMRNGSAYLPPPCAGVFDDVPCPSLFADYIETLFNLQIAAGCSASPPLYCPTDVTKRKQMAAFLVRTFGLLVYGD